MKIVYMGTPDFAVPALESIINAGHEVLCVVTQPDRPKGRGKELAVSPVKACALEHNLPVFQPERIKTAESVEYLRNLSADLFVVAAFGQILSQEVLDLPRYGCVNIHASLLPLYRGAAPIQQAVLDGQSETGVTIMKMDIGCDTGDILLQERIPITEEDTAGTMFDKLATLGAETIVKALPLIEAGELTPVKQDEEKSTKAGKVRKEEGHLNWEHDAAFLCRLIRAMSPWPSAYTRMEGKTLKIWKARALPQARAAGAAGTITEVGKDYLTIQTGNGLVCVTELQLEGKRRMTTEEFLRGCHVTAGTILQ